MKIFISYAGEHRSVADNCAVRLRGEGHIVFFDKDNLPPADSYDASIRKAVAICDLFIFLISPESIVPGSYAQTEMALVRSKWASPVGHVLPVMISPTTWKDLPVYLTAVTILTPPGDPVADILGEVAKLKRSFIPKRALWVGGLAAVVVVSWYFAVPVSSICRLNVTLHAPELRTATHPRVLVKSGGMTNTFLISSQGNSPVEMVLKASEPWTLKVVDDEKELLQPVDILGCPTSPMERNFNGNMQLSVEPR